MPDLHSKLKKPCVKAHAAGSKRNPKSARPRKIVPSVPTHSGLLAHVPQSVLKLAAGCVDAERLKLQSCFLDMYSASQQTVPHLLQMHS